MNIAKIMIPKISTVFLYENYTVRQGLEQFMFYGYTAIPVLNEKEQYIGSVTEGDFLRHILSIGTTELKALEHERIANIVRQEFCPALFIDSSLEQVIFSTLLQNFVPIVDSRNMLSGILTRQIIIKYLSGINK